MGIFDWAMKGVSTERRPLPQKEQVAPPQMEQAPIQQTPPPVEHHQPEPDPVDKASAVLFNFQTPPQQNYMQPTYHAQPQNFNGAFQGNSLGNRHILVVTPRTDNEVFGIVEHLKTNEAVIVNFEGTPLHETQRRIDFLSGVACGLNGTIRPLDAHKYIITPSGIGVR